MTIISSNLHWSKDRWKEIIQADAKGYYAWLPAVFIYNDLNFEFFDITENGKYYIEGKVYEYRIGANDHVINKYYCGTALAQLPFFLIAHLSSYLLDYDMDGYSRLYPILINIAALFYLLAGLIFLNLILKTYKINEWLIALTLFAAVFGSNLFYYTIVEPGLSHIYSFAFISMFFYFSKQYFVAFQKKHILFLGILLGIIILIRPVNGLIVFIWPFAAGNFNSLKMGLREALSHKLVLLYSIFACLGIVFIQLIIYKISTGLFFVYSYGGEGFNFLNPHMIDILFSYKKGLFLYTPMYLLSFTGCWFLWKTSKFELFSWFTFFLLITYVFSSWWMWFYGGSFSSRVYVEYIPLFMILLAISLNGIKSKLFKPIFIALVVLLIIACQIQIFQYRYCHIHWVDMNKEKYWEVFMRIDRLIH